MRYPFIILVGIIGLAVGNIAGFSTFLYQRVPSRLPIPIVAVQNPVIGTFFASRAEGTVIKKTQDSFTLEQHGAKMTIWNEPTIGISSWVSEVPDEERRQVEFSEVRVGDYVAGGVNIVNDPILFAGSNHKQKGDVIAHRFSILRHAQ